jgi:hypothetical protein
MIKIKSGNQTAEYSRGAWESEDKSFAIMLNNAINPDLIPGYTPDIEEGLVELIRDKYPWFEIIEYKPREQVKQDEGTIY